MCQSGDLNKMLEEELCSKLDIKNGKIELILMHGTHIGLHWNSQSNQFPTERSS